MRQNDHFGERSSVPLATELGRPALKALRPVSTREMTGDSGASIGV